MKNKKSIASVNPHLRTAQQRKEYAVRFALASSRIEGIKPSAALTKKLGSSVRAVHSSR
jgi:hypothetical protein